MPDTFPCINLVNGSKIVGIPSDGEWSSMSVEHSYPVPASDIDEALKQLHIMFEHPRYFWMPVDPHIACRYARARDMRRRRPLRSHRRAMQHLAMQRSYGGSHEQRMRRRLGL